MRLLDDPRLKAYIEEAVGDEGMRIAELLLSREEATDTQIAEELGEKPSHVRKVLYNLYEARVADYHKEKDKETGWLTFYWYLTPDHVEHALEMRRKRELDRLEERLRFESEHEFFVCPTGHERFDFATATETDFHCPEHGEMLDAFDNAKEIEAIHARIEALRAASARPEGA